MSWQPDSESDSCTLCGDLFTFFNRKHHCRKCGKLVCGACSGQFLTYPSHALVLHGDRQPTKPSLLGQYRTCEPCALEIERAQEAGDPEGALDAVAPKSMAVPAANQTSKNPRVSPEVAEEVGEEDLCPVCGTNLLQQFKLQDDCIDLDQFKEGHVSECITSFDFSSQHLRLSSPVGTLTSRNRMLVYNIPPIPKPSYEAIPNSKGEYGLVTSVATMTSEKEPSDNECVICLDDLKPGDKVGRLECLCVFHYICIKDWFNKKSFAECPIHFLHR